MLTLDEPWSREDRGDLLLRLGGLLLRLLLRLRLRLLENKRKVVKPFHWIRDVSSPSTVR